MTVAIAGAAECDLGKTGLDVLTLQSQAVIRALTDAGLTLSDVDGLATNNIGRFPVIQLAEYLGLRPRWCDSTFVGGSAFEMYVARAAQAIDAGQCSTVVISYASNQRSARSRTLTAAGDEYESPYRPLYPASYYAMVAQRYLHTYGLDRRHLAQVAVSARERAQRNPKAWTYGAGPLTVEEVLAAPLVSSPLGVLDCCLVTDGGGAVVLTSLERARDLPRPPAVVLGCGEMLDHTSMATAKDLLRTGAVESGRTALRAAGLTPADIDVIQLYDAFTISVPLGLEQLGFAAPGEGLSVTTPMNTGGGGLAYCHPGQFGVLLLVEAVRQLRETSAETALVHGTGGIFSSHATVILGVDR
ncbi:thiolase C-terminal domain-containing protein [Paractinoplanes atraurantiacus]|uniref:Acetyl-CoA acetyltransferase n=1 Tax=Paractinoplanes atraurantiacus TaxID=1036182 RepID=A0A285K2E4_9ACTN|nr:thiolase [Actinoplanes atraurantiacus]SNY66744.1 Acetyl-CoA acetyltransferase [Actinoplanes atraurantiacus]